MNLLVKVRAPESKDQAAGVGNRGQGAGAQEGGGTGLELVKGDSGLK